jgi:DNA-binding NarL/FixJ family response regulator
MVRVLLISNIRLYREGLVLMLKRDGRLEVVGAEVTVAEAIERLRRLGATVVLLDMSAAGALTSAQAMLAECPSAKVIALGVSESVSDVIACAEAGLTGYICRGSSLDELVTAIEAAARGELHCSAAVAAGLMERVGELAAGVGAGAEAHLTRREMDIVQLLHGGLTNQQIAAHLHIELSTVKTHVHNLLGKLGVRRRADAAAKLCASWCGSDGRTCPVRSAQDPSLVALAPRPQPDKTSVSLRGTA